MLCELCSKKQATVHYTEIHNSEMREMHLCEDCTRKKETELKPYFSLADFLTGLGDFEPSLNLESRQKCPSCGMTMADFKQSGRLGCGECYTAFRDNLAPLLKRIHGRFNHTGKRRGFPGKAPERTLLEKLKVELQQAVSREEFEAAAKIRDKIKETEKQAED